LCRMAKLAASWSSTRSGPADRQGDGASLEDLLGHLETQAQAARLVAADPRPQVGPRIPLMQDRWRPAWSPPPEKRHVVKKTGDSLRPEFVRFVKTAGENIHANPGYLKSQKQLLSPRSIHRLNMAERSYARLPSQVRYRSQPEAFGDPGDEMCEMRHQKWLQAHAKRRDRHVHEVYYSLGRVADAERVVASHAEKLELTRSIAEAGALDPVKMTETAHRGFSKVKRGLNTLSMIRNAAADRAAAEGKAAFEPAKLKEERANKARLEKAQSATCLELRPLTPKGAAKHIRSWKGPEGTLRLLRSSTPWIDQDEMRELGRQTRSTGTLR